MLLLCGSTAKLHSTMLQDTHAAHTTPNITRTNKHCTSWLPISTTPLANHMPWHLRTCLLHTAPRPCTSNTHVQCITRHKYTHTHTLITAPNFHRSVALVSAAYPDAHWTGTFSMPRTAHPTTSGCSQPKTDHVVLPPTATLLGHTSRPMHTAPPTSPFHWLVVRVDPLTAWTPGSAHPPAAPVCHPP